VQRATSVIHVPAVMMVDIAQVQSGFKLEAIMPVLAVATLTLSGFGLRNEIRGDIKDVNNKVNENLVQTPRMPGNLC
jgi:hypothetical protein